MNLEKNKYRSLTMTNDKNDIFEGEMKIPELNARSHSLIQLENKN
jgi:hypothetical protein